MNTQRNLARIIGVLFLIPFFGYGVGNGLISSVLDSSNYLEMISPSKLQITIGGLLMLLNSISVVGIGVMIFPVIEEHNKRAAIGYLCTRIVEAVILTVGIICLLLAMTLGENHAKADTAALTMLFDLAKKANFWAYQIAMIALGLGSIWFCMVLWKSHLVPAPLALLGLAGYCLLVIGVVLEFFGFGVGIMLSVPGGLFEMGLAVWLLVKGFNMPNGKPQGY